jgi:hypothetical protein
MSGEMKRGIEKMTARMLAVLLAAGVCLLLAAPAALAAAPAFKVTASSYPTNFIAGEDASKGELGGPYYDVVATNVGSAPTSGSTTFTQTLPEGLTAVRSFIVDRPTGGGGSCTIAAPTVTCTESNSLQPGEWALMRVRVKVAEEVGPSLTSQASVLGGGAAEAIATTTTAISSAIPSYAFLPGAAGLSLAATGTDGAPATQAGSHPGQVTLDFGFPRRQKGEDLLSAGHLRTLKASLPRGMVANPNATPVRCLEAQLMEDDAGGVGCPWASQIGTVAISTRLAEIDPESAPLYNMVPPPGVAAEFAFDAFGLGIYTHVMGGVNSAGEYELGSDTSEILARQSNPVTAAQVQLWGNPSDVIHDAMRGNCGFKFKGTCPLAERTNTPFLTMPSSCRSSLSATASTADWEEPGNFHNRSVLVEDSLSDPTATDGCNQLEFKPTVEVKPSTNLADSPSGLDVNLHVPQTTGIEDLATANFKDVKLTFPKGMAVNPASANGQGSCSSSQIGLSTPIGDSHPHFSEDPANCPDAAKLGTVEVITPLLDHSLHGALFLANPFDNPFNSLVAIYLDVEDPQSGVVSKLAGKVDLDPQTGQITASFAENPELPIEDVKVSLFKGPRAALITPPTCATYTTTADITPWSTPEGADVHPADSFATTLPASGNGACPSSEAQAPNTPSFTAGTLAPQAGAYTPFVLKLSREDGTQRLTGIDATLPKGLLAKLAGTTYCSEAQIAAAKGREAPRQGALEQQSPSCPMSSEVGSVSVGAGAGITPYYASGHAYLAGPYKGAPLSLVVITPAVAGPFDLGSVVVRTALHVNSETAEVHAVSDPLPTIREGIPLDVRSIVLKMDRPDFTLNPTSCDPMAIVGSALMATGQGAALTSPFQVGGCNALKFAPKLKITLKGATKRTGHPALKAVVTYPKGNYANIAKAQVTLPHSAFLDTTHIKTICTRVQFAADQCPPGAIYGFARATTPLLDNPVEGPVYLRSSSHKLPDLVLALGGQIDADAVARVDTGKGDGIRTTFEAIPDVPLSRVVLEMKGGRKGLLVNSENICKKAQKAIADFTAHNGKVYDTTPLIANGCSKKAKRKHKKHKAKKSKPSKARR